MTASKTSTVRNAVDTWANASSTSTKKKNYAQGAGLGVASGGSGAIAYVYHGAPMPRGVTVLSATLRLYTRGDWGGASPTITVKRLGEKFAVSKLTYNNRPSSTGTSVTSSHASTGDGDVWEFDVSAHMQTVADGAAWYGFEVTSSSSTRRYFRSSQNSDLRPELEVTYADAPDTPTTLTPNGQTIGVSKPTVECDYTDPTGGTLTSMQVHLKATDTGWTSAGGFSSPDYDTGEVTVDAGSTARLDLSATAYGGAGSGDTVYWTARVRDDSGEWSAWADVADFTYTPKGTLSIDSPSSGSPVLTDYTPPVLATVSSMTLTKYRVLVDRLDTGSRVFDSDQVPDAGPSFEQTIDGPHGRAVLSKGVSYRLTVRAWDDEDRVSTANDPAYVEATRDFTVTAGAQTAPTGVTATVIESPPGVQLDFTSATAPDGFTFTIDGEAVEANVDPLDVFVSGTSYRYTFSRIRPNVEADFGVTRVVNGDTSALVEATVTPSIFGAWLIDPDRSRHLFIAKTGGSTIEPGEDAETLVPLGAEAGIRVTQGLRGYEGTITGALVSMPDFGKTLQEYVDLALRMRAKPGRTYVLLIGTEAFEVVIGNLKVRPTGDSTPGVRPISFDFWQTSDQRIAVSL